ncbi:MAG: nuclear transport factor 2 family protein [Flammeovirgaceae bacterium]|nr:nuclear transport factor 2 family protein [Flammeovirgaceae bacterium]
MKKIHLLIAIQLIICTSIFAQENRSEESDKEAIRSLIDQYTQAREDKNSELLKKILTNEIDQLVSSGEWRVGKTAALSGMMRSSGKNPGSRTITVEKIRFINQKCGIADTRYEIKNADGSVRKMWSTFIVSFEENMWKITGIRNMLPAK